MIRAWERSGETATRFAESRGLSPRTLAWWKWRLKQDGAAAAAATAIQLVPVRAAEDVHGDGLGVDGELAWEIEGPAGHVLRVRGRASAQALRAALVVIERGGRRR